MNIHVVYKSYASAIAISGAAVAKSGALTCGPESDAASCILGDLGDGSAENWAGEGQQNADGSAYSVHGCNERRRETGR